jgi:hypothetical protein
MGNMLTTVRDGLEKDAEGASKAAQEVLKGLEALAQEKLDHFYATIS